MNILWITNIPSPYRVDFFNQLGENVGLTVLFELTSASDRNKNWAGGDFKNFKGIMLKGIKSGRDKAFCPEAIKWLHCGRFDKIVISNYSTPTGMLAILWLKLKKLSFILEADGGFFKEGMDLKERIKRYLIGSATYWFSSGAKTTEYLVHYGAKKEKIYVYPFSSIRQNQIIENVPSHEEKMKLRNALGIKGRHVAVTVGQFIHRKGFDTLINAWAEADPINELIIIGGGELYEEYKEQIKRLLIKNIRLIGFKKREELFGFYKAADLFILPTREDIWGLVVNEAMACGLPVITTNKCIAGLELVENNINGYIVPVEDIKLLSEKINAVLTNEDTLKYMADNSLDKIRKYTLENMVSKHLEYLQSF